MNITFVMGSDINQENISLEMQKSTWPKYEFGEYLNIV